MITAVPATETPSRNEVWRMFDGIAHRYDLLNSSLSLGQDSRWRKRMRRYLPDRANLHVLDLATGTAEQLLCLSDDQRVVSGVGVDLAANMLEVGRKKIAARGRTHMLRLISGDAAAIPMPDASADVVSISFGIRNVLNVDQSFREMFRVLKPGGRALVLEFSMPDNTILRRMYLCYFRHILPRVGAWVSGDRYAYQYLNQTVETFPSGPAFCTRMEQSGFHQSRWHPLTFGVASIYQADKPE